MIKSFECLNTLIPNPDIFRIFTLTMSQDLTARIEDALNQVRPFLEADGGNVKLLEITPEMVVKLELEGACKSCSMRMMTFKAGLEETLKRAVPEITGVEAVNLHTEFTL